MQRPTSVVVFGILNIVFAGLGAFGLLATLFLFSTQMDPNNPVVKLMHDSPMYAVWLKIGIFLGALSSLALLVSGIGLLCFQAWARTLSIVYAIYAIVMGILATVVNIFVLDLPMIHQAAQANGAEKGAMIGGAIGGTIGGCFGLIYPLLLLIFMTRPKVTAAFRPAAEPVV